jgi:cell wall-associated protease
MRRWRAGSILLVTLGVLGVLRGPTATAATVSELRLWADRQAPQPDHTTIRWTASAVGGKTPYSYKWWVYDGSWRVVQEWTKNATSYTWTPLVPRSIYQVRVWVRSAGSTSDVAERVASMSFPIQQAVAGLALVSDKPSPQPAGRPITWNGTTTAGAAPVSFKWWVSDGATWTVLRDWSTSGSFTWTPSAANQKYSVRVGARGAGLSGEPEQTKTVAYPIQPALTGLSLQPDRPAPQPVGTSITWRAAATGGVAPYSYRWVLLDGSTATQLQNWSTKDTLTWTPASAGANYSVRVLARSAGSENDGELSATIAYEIQPTAPRDGECTYTVTPRTITIGSGNATNEVHVSTGDGCPWTAETVDGGVVDYLSPESGSGTDVITLWVSNNTSPDFRISKLRVAEQSVVVTQVPLAPDPTCNYSLSSSSTTIPVNGGSGSVDVLTTDGCSWTASSGVAWVRLTGNTGGTGPGRVSFDVDANPGAGRNMTLYVAGAGLDVLQDGTDPSTGSQETTWNQEPVFATESFIVTRPFDGYYWESYPDVHASDLGECFGNCGAGCSNAFNPCGGRTQWWELQILDEPVPTGSFWQDVLCYGDFYYLYEFERYAAAGRWIYHGHAASGCAAHDASCPETIWIGCLIFTGCGTEWDQDWSYEDMVLGSKLLNIQEMGPGTCN